MIDDKIIGELKYRFENQDNFISNASNFTAIIIDNIDDLNWVGFYMISNGKLILGPFQGKAAVTKIELSNGVCGAAASSLKTCLVGDVHNFEGHIACDLASNSEIVIPIIFKEKLYGVLDIDSPLINRFDEELKSELQDYLAILIEKSDLGKVWDYYN